MKQSTLSNLKQFRLSGGSERVLNNLLTSDLQKVDAKSQWSAFCNVNGQVITTTWVCKEANDYCFTCDHSLVDMLIQHIQHHALRNQFKVEFTDESLVTIAVTSLEEAITNKFPIITSDTTGQFIPQMLGMQNHPGAIDFEKGCYLGQEIIMRAEQLGKVKRGLRVGSINQRPETDVIYDKHKKVCGKLINVSEQKPYLFNMVTNQLIDELYLDDKLIDLFS